VNTKYLKYVDFSFDGRELEIGRVAKDGGARKSVTIPYRNLYSLISYSVRAYHEKTKTQQKKVRRPVPEGNK